MRDSLGSGPAAGAGPAPRHIAGDHDRQYVLHDADAEERAAAAEAAAAAGDAARRVLAPLDHPLPPFPPSSARAAPALPALPAVRPV